MDVVKINEPRYSVTLSTKEVYALMAVLGPFSLTLMEKHVTYSNMVTSGKITAYEVAHTLIPDSTESFYNKLRKAIGLE